jgi:hypothetical protein
MINVDDKTNGRIYPNKQISNIFTDLSKNHKLEYNINLQNLYIRNTCLSNSKFIIDETDNGFISSGSFGIIRRGKTFKNKIKNTVFKLFFSTAEEDPSYGYCVHEELLEIKYGIELMNRIPHSVIQIISVDNCQILTGETGPDDIYKAETLVIMGLEQGKNFLNFLKKSNAAIFSDYLSQAMDACDNLNRHGYIHNDMKLQNIVIVNRNNIQIPVIIDFGRTDYFEPELKTINFKNIPLDSFYLGLYAFHVLDFLTQNDTDKLNKQKIIFDLCWKFYRILNYFSVLMEIDVDKIIKIFAKDIWLIPSYGYKSSFEYFKNLIQVYKYNEKEMGGLSPDKNFSNEISEEDQYIISKYIRPRYQSTIKQKKIKIYIPEFDIKDIFDVFKKELQPH